MNSQEQNGNIFLTPFTAGHISSFHTDYWATNQDVIIYLPGMLRFHTLLLRAQVGERSHSRAMCMDYSSCTGCSSWFQRHAIGLLVDISSQHYSPQLLQSTRVRQGQQASMAWCQLSAGSAIYCTPSSAPLPWAADVSFTEW